jgi:hypothetical protein
MAHTLPLHIVNRLLQTVCVCGVQERRLKRLGLMDEDGSTTYDSFFRDGIA